MQQMRDGGKKASTDVRPVFPEERLLIEIILQKPFEFLKKSVWNGTGNHYFVNGKKITFSVKELKKINADEFRRQYEKYSTQNTYCYFDEMTGRFLRQIKNGMSISRRRQEIIYEKQWVSLVQWICLFHSVEAKILQ